LLPEAEVVAEAAVPGLATAVVLVAALKDNVVLVPMTEKY
jgi:hypothetical protein